MYRVASLAPGRELPSGQAAMPLAENRWTKKRKAEEEAAIVPAANVVVQFQSDAGETAGEYLVPVCPKHAWTGVTSLHLSSLLFGPVGPQLSVPQDATVKQLNLLLNQLLDNEEKLPYSFFVEEQELASSLGEHLQKNKVCQSRAYTAYDMARCDQVCKS